MLINFLVLQLFFFDILSIQFVQKICDRFSRRLAKSVTKNFLLGRGWGGHCRIRQAFYSSDFRPSLLF